MSLKSKIQSLLAAANETTGESDTNLTDAMQNLIDGYGGGVTKYAVTYSLATHLASSNTASKVADGNSYTTTIISTELDYTVGTITVTMGGTDISSTAVSGNVITIASVTGAIAISATALYFPAVETNVDALTVLSGGTGTLQVKLHAQPTQSQTVSLYSDGLTLSENSLTFTTSNWNTYQSVTVTAPSVDDTSYEYVNITNSDPLMTETTIMVTVNVPSYDDLVDTTIPTTGMHTVTTSDFESTNAYGNFLRVYKYVGSATNIYVPATLGGKQTWIVANQTFKGNTDIEYVTFEDGVIYRNAGTTSGCLAGELFGGCTSLKGVSNINTATTSIDQAFSNCTSLEFVDNLDELVNLTNTHRAFWNSGIEYVQDLSSITGAGLSRTFEGATNFKKIFGMPQPSSGASFEYAFMNTQVKSIVFPVNTSSLKYAFYGCSTVERVEILADGLSTTNLTSIFNTSQNISVYANANSTTIASLQSMYASSSNITIYDRSGATLPNIVVWGDSTSSAGRTWVEWPKRLQSKIGTSDYLVKNEAQSGEYTCSTAARQGGDTLTVDAFTLPATTDAVDITLHTADGYTFSNSPIFSGGQSFNPCLVSGVSCRITHTNGSQYNQIRRLEAGTAVSVSANTVVTSEADSRLNKAGDIMLINLGHNAGWNDTPSKLLGQLQMMVDHFLDCGGTDYIVSGPWSGWWISDPRGWAIVEQVASLAEVAFGNHWLDLPADIAANCQTDNPNVEWTAEDLQYISEGKTPVGSLTYDNVHPTPEGANSQMMAFYRKGVALGYWT